MSKSFLLIAVFVTLFAVGCGSAPSDAPATNETKNTTNQTQQVEVGMEAAKIKEIKGAPDDSRHEHGPNGEEIDVWIWKDLRVTLQGGKATKVEKL